MKVAELTGESLDWWVAQAEGMLRLIKGTRAEKLGGYSPSTKWTHGGLIIEKAAISIEVSLYDNQTNKKALRWFARIEPPWPADQEDEPRWIMAEGDTPLEAAMRAYVWLKFGDEVPDEVVA